MCFRFCFVAGSTVASWQLLCGRKEGTDTHSYTARTLGISYDNAKEFNSARLYGPVLAQAELVLLQYNPQLSDADASKLAREVYRRTKGIKRFARTKNLTVINSTAAVANDGANTADTAHTADSQSAAAIKGTKRMEKRVQVDADEGSLLQRLVCLYA